jgi:RNA polymerase sigma factor (sigma-70 family)
MSPTNPLLRHVRHLADRTAPPSDRDLLHRFAAARDEDAFAELVRRHAPMVQGVCERALHNRQDAEDTVQACFLVLARKAGSPAWQPCIGPWLYQVAYRLARKARAGGARRCARQAGLAQRPEAAPAEEPSARELHMVLDEELARLSVKYRAPLVLCYLEGQTRDEAAQQLGCPLGTLKSRLERGRDLLRSRLTRRGVTLSTALMVVGLAPGASRATSAELAAAFTAKAAALAGGTARGLVLKLAALVAIGVFTAGAVLLAHRLPVEQRPGETTPAAKGDQPARTDRRGDPLPDEALARLGTIRFRYGGFINALGFTPDGANLVVRGTDYVQVMDAGTGKEVRRFGHELGMIIASSLSSDGKLIALASYRKGGKVSIWEVPTGRLLRQFGERDCNEILFSPDGKVLATSCWWHCTVVLWDTTTGKHLATLTHEEHLWPLAFSADGKTLISGDDKGTIRFWDVATHKLVRQIASAGRVARLALSPDGALLAAVVGTKRAGARATPGTTEDQVFLWDARTGKELRRLMMPAMQRDLEQPVRVLDAAFTPDGTALVTSERGVVRVWDPATGTQLRQFPGLAGYPGAFAFPPGGKTLAVAEGNTVVKLIDLMSGKDLFPTEGHRSWITLTALAPDGRTVMTAGGDNTLRLWDVASARELRLRAFPELEWLGRGGFVYWPQLLVDDRGYLAAGLGQTLRVCDLDTGKELRLLRGHDGRSPFALCSDGKTLAALTEDLKAIRILDTATGTTLHTLKDLPGQVMGLSFSPDGRRLFAWGWGGDRMVLRWDVATGRKLSPFSVPTLPPTAGLPPPEDASFAGKVSPDGKLLIFGLQEGYIVALETITGREVCRFAVAPGDGLVSAFSPDGKTLAWGGSKTPMVYLGEMATARVRHRFTGHQGSPICLAFSRDGKKLVSGATDGTALVWDLAGKKRPEGLSPRELDSYWSDLASEDAEAGYHAVQALAADPAHTIPYLRSRLRPVAAGPEKELTHWIADLDSEAFAVRDKATAELEKWGEGALPILRKALEARPGLEARRRLKELIDKQENQEWSPTGERLQVVRAVEALELAGTPESRQVLEILAGGAPWARLTRDARAALERLVRDRRKAEVSP